MKRIFLTLALMLICASGVMADAGNPAIVTIASAPQLYTYAFTAVNGTATLTGYFVDATGTQVTDIQTYSITTATDFTNLYDTANSITAGTPLPTTFYEFKGSLSGSALYLGNGATSTGALTYSPRAGYPQVSISNVVTFGKVY